MTTVQHPAAASREALGPTLIRLRQEGLDLVVVDAPHYVIPGPDGKFAFRSLAPGKYKVKAWNERSGDPTTSEIEIKEGANTTTLDLKGGAVTLPPDKFGNARQ